MFNEQLVGLMEVVDPLGDCVREFSLVLVFIEVGMVYQEGVLVGVLECFLCGGDIGVWVGFVGVGIVG